MCKLIKKSSYQKEDFQGESATHPSHARTSSHTVFLSRTHLTASVVEARMQSALVLWKHLNGTLPAMGHLKNVRERCRGGRDGFVDILSADTPLALLPPDARPLSAAQNRCHQYPRSRVRFSSVCACCSSALAMCGAFA